MKIEDEIKKIITDYAFPYEEGKSVLMEKEDIDNVVFKLVNLFKSYARSLVPEKKNPQPECHPVINNDEGYNYEEVYNPREINFAEGYNQCREEILNEIDKENK